MTQPRPYLNLDRPIREPDSFRPTTEWIEGDYIYRYDAQRQVCKRSPVKPSAVTGTMFFEARPVAPSPLKRLVTRHQPPRLVMAALWTIFGAAAMVFVFPLWPAAVYQWQQLHPAPTVSLGVTTARTATTSRASRATAKAATPSAATAADVVPITDNRVIIPKIGVDTPIVEGSSLKVLDQTEGVWHQTGSVTHGNFVLAGHRFRYLPPNTSTLYNLDKLAVGYLIAVDWLGKRTVYQVTQTEVVPQNDVAILNPTSTPRLTLYSCNDIRQTQRVVAIAQPLPAP